MKHYHKPRSPDPIDPGLEVSFEKAHRGRTPRGTKPSSQVLNHFCRTPDEKRAFARRVAKRLAKKKGARR